jgi:hypothetical protein
MLARIPVLVAAIKKYLAGKTLVLNGVTITAEELINSLLAYAAALTTSNEVHAQWGDTVAAARKLEPTANTQILGLENYVRMMYGNAKAVLGAFGMAPRKVAKRSAATQAEANERSLATRVARHTVGPKEKAKIHGEVPPAPQTPEVKPKA